MPVSRLSEKFQALNMINDRLLEISNIYNLLQKMMTNYNPLNLKTKSSLTVRDI
jgi:hypothetical protein